MICASKPDQVYCFDLSHPIPNEKMKLTDAIFRRTLEYQAEIPELFILMKLIILWHYDKTTSITSMKLAALWKR